MLGCSTAAVQKYIKKEIISPIATTASPSLLQQLHPHCGRCVSINQFERSSSLNCSTVGITVRLCLVHQHPCIPVCRCLQASLWCAWSPCCTLLPPAPPPHVVPSASTLLGRSPLSLVDQVCLDPLYTHVRSAAACSHLQPCWTLLAQHACVLLHVVMTDHWDSAPAC